MKPSVQKIITKLNKEKVELGLLQDINSDYNFLFKNVNSVESKFWDALETANGVKNLLLKDLDKLDKLQKDIISAKRKLKDIGLENQVSELDKISSKVDVMIKTVTKVKNTNV